MRWISPLRYYSAEIITDLLGDLIIHIVHGGRFNQRYTVRNIPVTSMADANKKLAALHKIRIKHGYLLS